MTYALTFPGQGSQSVGMLGELASVYPLVKNTFEEASEVLGYDLWQLTQQGPEAELNRTDRTQPAMLVAGMACARVLEAQSGRKPLLCAGHSLAEYTALCYADALDFADAVRLVAARGQYMQEAVPQGVGAMAAILGLDDAQVAIACDQAAQGQSVAPANFNSPGQVVIAGHKTAVERAMEAAKTLGAKRAVLLAVSVPAHCELMRPAAERLRATLQDITVRLPQIPVIHNVDAAMHPNPDAIRAALIDQLCLPVRWVDSVRALVAQGITLTLETGPGKVLAGINKRIDKNLNALPVFDPKTLDQALASLAQG